MSDLFDTIYGLAFLLGFIGIVLLILYGASNAPL